jgi:hypothetical protein
LRRPIRNVACRVTPEGQTPERAAVSGQLTEVQITAGEAAGILRRTDRGRAWRLVPAGLRCAFVFGFDVDAYPKVATNTRFADDAGVNWEIDHELHLVKLGPREGWW